MTNTKMSDKLLEAFLWIWELVFFCVALPLALGLSWLIIGAVSEILDKIYLTALSHPYIYYTISIIIGICLKIWQVDRRKKGHKNE